MMSHTLKTLAVTVAFLAPAQALACAMYMPEKEAPLIALMDEIDEAAEDIKDEAAMQASLAQAEVQAQALRTRSALMAKLSPERSSEALSDLIETIEIAGIEPVADADEPAPADQAPTPQS